MLETNKTPKKVHAFTQDVLGDLDAVGIANLINSKKISSKEVVQASIERVKKVEPHLNALAYENFENALKATDNIGTGFFAGVPTFLKDLTNVKGFKTKYGSEAFDNIKTSKKTDKIAKQIFDQGFIHLGNSTLPEFGFTCSTEFPHLPATVNPWNTEYSCGGSSGGAAALVASGVVPLAHSADGGGSTRIPAACCGLVGLKASRGRVLASGIFEQQIIDIAIDGVVTRSVRDTAHFYAEAEKYYKNPKLKPIGLIEGASNKKYKFAFCNESLKGVFGDTKNEAVLRDTAKLLEAQGHTVKEIKVPVRQDFVDDFVDLWGLLAFLSKHFGFTAFGKHYDKKKLTNLLDGLSSSYPKNFLRTPFFLYRLKKTYSDYENIFKSLDVDFILTPTMAHTTPKIGYLGADLDFETMFGRMKDWASFTPYCNTSGGPAISLPMGHDDATDLPIGMMFWGKHHREDMLIDLAYQLEEAKPWKKIHR